MKWNDIAARHFDWVERMGWHNKTVLEALALIASEIGEAAAECYDDEPTAKFGEELADIVLRTLDLAHWQGVDLDAVVASTSVAWRTPSLFARHAELGIDMAYWINTARKAELGDDFVRLMGVIMCRVVSLATTAGVPLQEEVLRKMDINEQRGTRGRRI